MNFKKLLMLGIIASAASSSAYAGLNKFHKAADLTSSSSSSCTSTCEELNVHAVAGAYISKLFIASSPDIPAGEEIRSATLVLNSDKTAQFVDSNAIVNGTQITPASGAWRIRDGVVEVVVYDYFHFATGDQASKGWDEYDRIAIELSNFVFDCDTVVSADFRLRLDGLFKFNSCGNVCDAEVDPQSCDAPIDVSALRKGVFNRIVVQDCLFPVEDCAEVAAQ